MKKWITPFLAFGALLFLAACNGTPEVISNGLRIVITKIERAPEGSYTVTWQVENPNVVSYVVDRSEHKIFLDDVLVGTVFKKSRVGVPVRERAEGIDPLVSAGPAGNEKLAQVLAQGSAAYRVESTIWVLLSDDETSKSKLSSAGTVAVTAK